MPDSVRVKEIHAALDAGKFTVDASNPGSPRVANLGYYIERIARILGISVDADGNVRSIRQRATIPAGQSIPAGWNFGQWGENTGDAYQKGASGGAVVGVRDGIAIEGIPNKLVPDPYHPGKFKVVGGDYILCENIPQLLAEIVDQFDAALGLQESGAFTLPDAGGSNHVHFEGLHALVAEIAYTVSKISQNTTQTQISSLLTQAITKEILAAGGQPIVSKTLAIDTGDSHLAKGVYPGLAMDAPTTLKALGWVLQNLSILVGAKVKE